MRTKVLILVAALVLGAIAAVLAARYLTEARSTIESESEPVEVLVAQEDIPRGVSAEELLANDLIVLEKVPRRFVASGAISSEAAKIAVGRSRAGSPSSCFAARYPPSVVKSAFRTMRGSGTRSAARSASS